MRLALTLSLVAARGRRLRVHRHQGPRSRHRQGTAADGAARMGGALPGRQGGARLRRLVLHGDERRLDRRPLGREQVAGRLGGRRSAPRQPRGHSACCCSRTTISTSSTAATEAATFRRSGLRRATRLRCRSCSGPGQTWKGTIAAPGALAGGLWVRLSFGPFTSVGDPPEGAQPQVVWFTDHAHRLAEVDAEPA